MRPSSGFSFIEACLELTPVKAELFAFQLWVLSWVLSWVLRWSSNVNGWDQKSEDYCCTSYYYFRSLKVNFSNPMTNADLKLAFIIQIACFIHLKAMFSRFHIHYIDYIYYFRGEINLQRVIFNYMYCHVQRSQV